MPDPRDLPEWMIELAQQIKLIPADLVLPTGVIVGSAVIEKCLLLPGTSNKLRLASHRHSARKPTRHPQPAWFNPF